MLPKGPQLPILICELPKVTLKNLENFAKMRLASLKLKIRTTVQSLSQIPKPFNTVWKSIYRLTKQIWNSLPRYLFLKDYFSHEDIIDNFWKLVSPYRLSVFRISFPANLQYYDQSILQIQSLQQRSMINFWNLSQFLKNNVKISTF